MDKISCVFDFSTVKKYSDIHDVLADGLKYSEPYRGDLDSLYDCLTDILAYISKIEIIAPDVLRKYDGYDEKILSAFRDAKHAWGRKSQERFFVTVVYTDGSREEID